MSKYPCHVVQDLLPNYIDGVCSEKTEAVVREHIGECRECKTLYESMTGELCGLPSVSQDRKKSASEKAAVCSSEEEKKILQGVNDRFTRNARKNKIISIAVCIAAVLLFLLTLLPIKRIPAEAVDISIREVELTYRQEDALKTVNNTPFTAWSENTIFFSPEGKDIDDCIFTKACSEEYPDIVFAIDNDYLEDRSGVFCISSVVIESDYAIKNYSVEYITENGRTLLHLETARTTLFDNGNENINSSVSLFYAGDIEGVNIY